MTVSDLTTSLLELAARVEGGSGPDRELDALICIAFNYIGPRFEGQTFQGEPVNLRIADDPWSEDRPWDDLYYEDAEGEAWSDRTPKLTVSLDAVKALIERVLPGKSWSVRSSGFGPPASAEIYDPMEQPGFGRRYLATNDLGDPARALLAALLYAKASETKDTAL